MHVVCSFLAQPVNTFFCDEACYWRQALLLRLECDYVAQCFIDATAILKVLPHPVMGVAIVYFRRDFVRVLKAHGSVTRFTIPDGVITKKITHSGAITAMGTKVAAQEHDLADCALFGPAVIIPSSNIPDVLPVLILRFAWRPDPLNIARHVFPGLHDFTNNRFL